MNSKHPIIIIGSGLAGYMLAKEFRKLDKDTPLTIVTASDGRFYSKPLLSTALTQKKEPEVLAVSSAAGMAEELHAVVLNHTSVESIVAEQHKIQLHHNEDLSYSKLVLACGAEVLQAPLKGNAVSKIYSVNDLQDYTRFREALVGKKKIAILGSGLVGCEFANDLANAGFEVSLIAPDQYPLQRLVPSKIGECVHQAFTEAGIQFHLGRFVTAVDFQDAHYQLSLSDGSFLEADLVLSAVGLKPNLKLAQTAGLESKCGIVVDQQLRSSQSDIYALGDCAEVMGQVNLYVAPLLQSARVLAQGLAGQQASLNYPIMPIVIKTPLCPVSVHWPPKGQAFEWQFSGEGIHARGLAYQGDRLLGFALAGNCVKERVEWIKKTSS